MTNTFTSTAKVAFITLVLMGGLFAGATSALAASFNDDSQDPATLRVKNPNGTVNNTGWSTSAQGNPGDTISFAIYYHNTSNETANDVRVRLTPQSTSDGTSHTFTGRVWADNAPEVLGTAVVTISSPESMAYDSGSGVAWRPDQTVSGSQSLPFGQNGNEIFSSNGLRLGDIESGWDHQGSVVLNFNIDESEDEDVLPEVQTLSTDGVGERFAIIKGHVDPNGSNNTKRWFEWGTNTSVTNDTPHEIHGSQSGTFTRVLNNIDPNTTYYYRAVAENDAGRVHGSIRSFHTLGSSEVGTPFVTTKSATGVTQTSATLNCRVDPRGTSGTTYWFQWGTTSSLGNTTSVSNAQSSAADVSRFVSGLQSNQTYHFRCVANNSFGTTNGSTHTFTTGNTTNNTAPTAITNLATNVGFTSARMNGLALNDSGAFTTGWFEWGRTTSLGNSTNVQNLGSSPSMAFIHSAFGLSSNTTYYYRAVVQNANGIDRGSIISFRTNSTPVTPPNPNPNPNPNPQPVRDVDIVKEIENLTNPNGSNTEIDALRGDFVRFTITVENTGNLTLEEVRIIDRVPDFLEFANAEEEGDNDPAREVVWFVGDLEEGEEREVTLDMIVTDDAPMNEEIVNVARIESERETQTSNEVTINVVSNIDGSGDGDDENGSGGLGLVFFGSGFFPDTLLGWLLLILLILALVIASRRLYGYRQDRIRQEGSASAYSAPASNPNPNPNPNAFSSQGGAPSNLPR